VIVLYFPDSHPSYQTWVEWCERKDIKLVTRVAELEQLTGDYLFLLSCTEVVRPEVYKRFGLACVIHESDLPKGRGWSPLAWQILEGKNEIVISALVCAEKVDRGDILAKRTLVLDGTELYDEINRKRNDVRRQLIIDVVLQNPTPKPQEGEPTYYKRRYPSDSELDPNKTIAEQFDLMRICDPRFPPFFSHRGATYRLMLSRMGEQ